MKTHNHPYPRKSLLLTLVNIFLVSAVLLEVNAQSIKTYPSDLGFIDVTQAPYNIKPNDNIDDTEGIQRAITDAGTTGAYGGNGTKVVYLPKGTYLINKTLEWRGYLNGVFRWCPMITLRGNGMDQTILKLKDYTFTNPSQPKSVLMTASGWTEGSDGGNNAFDNNIFDLTINVGIGNPGANGIDYVANNHSTVENVKIISTDPAKLGMAGVSMLRYGPGPCFFKNVIIDGFTYGININHYEYSQTYENLTLLNQKVFGILNTYNKISIRGLTSNNTVPVINATTDVALTVLIDARLTGGASDQYAILSKGRVYARNLVTSGYKSAIQYNGTEVAGTSHAEYISGGTVSLFESPKTSLNVPVQETPVYWDNELANWANVKNYGAIPDDGKDDTQAIQNAFNSGKTTVYFPKGTYHIKQTLSVGGKVKHIYGSYSRVYLTNDHTFTDAANLKPLLRFETGDNSFIIMETFSAFGRNKRKHCTGFSADRKCFFEIGGTKKYKFPGNCSNVQKCPRCRYAVYGRCRYA